MAPLTGFDTTHELDHAALRRNNASAVGRYIGSFRKATTKSAVDGYHAAGFGVWLIWESTATRALTGYTNGYKDALKANAAADALGAPANVVICWTVDTDVTPADVLPYARGFKAASRRPAAVYGEAGVIDRCMAEALVIDGWQTNARGWDQPRRTSPDASMRQHLAATVPGLGYVDPNDFDADTRLIWWPAGHELEHQTPTVPPGIAAWSGRTLRRGDRGKAVAEAFLLLRIAGYFGFALVPQTAAEAFGIGKEHAVRRFQRRHHLPVTGRIDEATFRAIATAAHAKLQKGKKR